MAPEILNRFLSCLSQESRALLLAHAVPVALPIRTPLYQADRVPTNAFFITSGIASVVTIMVDGGTAEVEVIGHEGVIGSLHLLGSAPIQTSCFMQAEGTGVRVPLADLRQAFRRSDEVRGRILEFVQTQALSVSQIAGCNRLHQAEARLARWMLMVQDRIQSDVLNFTQEFLAQMLGAQRTTVTMVAGALQRSGLIEYQRGQVKIVNRSNLEDAACDCYRVVKSLYTKLYSQGISGSV